MKILTGGPRLDCFRKAKDYKKPELHWFHPLLELASTGSPGQNVPISSQLHGQWRQLDCVKSATVGEFALWIVADTSNCHWFRLTPGKNHTKPPLRAENKLPLQMKCRIPGLWNGVKRKTHHTFNKNFPDNLGTNTFFFFLQSRDSFQSTITRDLHLKSEGMGLSLSLTID